MSLNNLKLSSKLAFAFSGVVLTVLLMVGVVFGVALLHQQTDVDNERSFEAEILLETAQLEIFNASSAVRGYMVTGSAKSRDRAISAERKFHEVVAELEKHASDEPSVHAPLEAFKAAQRDWKTGALDRQLGLMQNPATRQAALQTMSDPSVAEKLDRVRATADALTEAIDLWSTREGDEARASMRLIMTALIAGGLSAIALSVAMGWLLSRMIGAPVVSMTEVMRKLAGGDNTVEIPARDRKDEIGDMAGAVQVFKDAAIEKLRLEGMTAEQAKAAEEERARNEAAKAQAAREQQLVVDSIATGLTKLAAGDLVFRITQPFAPEYEKLRADFNGAMEQLQETMKVITGATQGIRSGTDEISQAADDLSKRTEQQAASLEETAAALDQITATVRKTAEGANHARDVVSTAKGDAEHSGEVVRNAVSAMSEIERSSQQISQIIGVIDEIAFQTNLLALNAGVEAARAGDAGKGFAVVASEVRALAQRSADAAKEIKTLISASTQQVGQGVALVGETGQALERIVAQVGEITNIVSEIAASAQEQATGLNQVNTAVNQMDQVTQQNAAMVEESTAASHSLATETEELARLISRFQVGQTAAAQARAPSARTPARAPVAALKTVSTHARGGGALARAAAEPTVDTDSWEEF
ncbi:methyl-accepting chemotaxis protein [Phenylobacterium sp.]|uniref:methyl-accepting chemotaxis protein n=1 Tax=Phenylobacterium sp. TaxID=1871053 RepID=UPI0028118263|nr:methyl-accepting chemotaxis protein [Phenylobacterium sp.]